MRARFFYGLSVALVLLAGLVGRPSDAAEAGAIFRRGVGVHRPLNWADLSAADPARYAWPPFGRETHRVSDALVAQIRKSGFDFVRLTVDPGPFLQMTGDLDSLESLLLAAIARFRAQDLGVVVNFHSNSQVPAYRPEAIFTDAEAPLFKAYAAMIGRVAGRLSALRDPRVALEPVNEPPAGYDVASAARWQAMMEKLYRAARAQAPHVPIVVTGAQGGSRRGLARLDPRPFRDPHTLYSFHYYEPHLLTHQGVDTPEPKERFRRDLRELPYPVRPEEEGAAFDATRRRIEADRGILDREKPLVIAAAREAISGYVREGWNARAIDDAFDGVTSWAARHGIDPSHVILGEFGATREDSILDSSRAQVRARWLRDVRCAAERRRFGWSIWELNGTGGMAVTDGDDPDRIDRLTRQSLGLLASAAFPACPP